MDNKVNQRLLAFSSLVMVFFISGFFRDAITKVVTNSFNEQQFAQTPQNDWQWNDSVADLCEQEKIYPIEREYPKHQKFYRDKRRFKHQKFDYQQMYSHGLIKVKADKKDRHPFLDEQRLYKYNYIND